MSRTSSLPFRCRPQTPIYGTAALGEPREIHLERTPCLHSRSDQAILHARPSELQLWVATEIATAVAMVIVSAIQAQAQSGTKNPAAAAAARALLHHHIAVIDATEIAKKRVNIAPAETGTATSTAAKIATAIVRIATMIVHLGHTTTSGRGRMTTGTDLGEIIWTGTRARRRRRHLPQSDKDRTTRHASLTTMIRSV